MKVDLISVLMTALDYRPCIRFEVDKRWYLTESSTTELFKLRRRSDAGLWIDLSTENSTLLEMTGSCKCLCYPEMRVQWGKAKVERFLRNSWKAKLNFLQLKSGALIKFTNIFKLLILKYMMTVNMIVSLILFLRVLLFYYILSSLYQYLKRHSRNVDIILMITDTSVHVTNFVKKYFRPWNSNPTCS